jgi:hypothetical protein
MYEINSAFKGEKCQKMNSKNMNTMVEFLGIMLLLGQFFRMVQGDVHFYDFVVSPYPWLEKHHCVSAFPLFIIILRSISTYMVHIY